MDPSAVFAKTPKGLEEVANRTYKLPPRLRALLIMVDGKISAAELAAKAASLGGIVPMLAELSSQGFIAAPTTQAAETVPAGAATGTATATAPRSLVGAGGQRTQRRLPGGRAPLRHRPDPYVAGTERRPAHRAAGKGAIARGAGYGRRALPPGVACDSRGAEGGTLLGGTVGPTALSTPPGARRKSDRLLSPCLGSGAG